jgi:hypothetical protein
MCSEVKGHSEMYVQLFMTMHISIMLLLSAWLIFLIIVIFTDRICILFIASSVPYCLCSFVCCVLSECGVVCVLCLMGKNPFSVKQIIIKNNTSF